MGSWWRVPVLALNCALSYEVWAAFLVPLHQVKLVAIIAFAIALFAVAMLLIVVAPDSLGPRFIRSTAPPSVQTNAQISYDFLDLRPFEGGRMWVNSFSGVSNSQVFLLDLKTRSVLGQLTMVGP